MVKFEIEVSEGLDLITDLRAIVWLFGCEFSDVVGQDRPVRYATLDDDETIDVRPIRAVLDGRERR